MAIQIPDQYAQKINELLSHVPNNPYVIDVIGKAVEISYLYPGFAEKLDIAIEAAKFASKVSEPLYYAIYLVQAPLVACINPAEYASLDTASGTLTSAASIITQFLTTTSFKERWNIMFKTAKDSPNLLAIILMHMNQDLEQLLAKETKTAEDMVLITGLGYLECCLRKSEINITNAVYPYKNTFMNLVLKKADF